MAASCGKSDRNADKQEEPGEGTEKSPALPENTVPLQRVHELLDKMSQKDGIRSKGNGEAGVGTKEKVESDAAEDSRVFRQSNQMQSSMFTTGALWRKDDGA